MIHVVLKPVPKAAVVDREGLYDAVFNGRKMFRVRARNARHAEQKIMFLVEHETKNKVIDYDLERFQKEKDNADRN